MGKKSKKDNQIQAPEAGKPLHLKHLGKPLYVLATVLSSAEAEDIWTQNSEEGKFVPLPETLTYYELDSIPAAKPGESLGLIVFTSPNIINTEKNEVTGEFLSFLVGKPQPWRNPKLGHLLEEDEDVVEALENSASFYTNAFPGYEKIYRIEEVIDPMGWSSSLTVRIDNQIKTLV